MDPEREDLISVGVAPDGTVSAATPEGTLVVELSRTRRGFPEIVTSVQRDLASSPREVARYPLRQFLALVLRAMRAARKRGRARAVIVAAELPARLRNAQRVALAKFVRVNFDSMMLVAHARRRWMPAYSALAH
jgi:hypothetical protein